MSEAKLTRRKIARDLEFSPYMLAVPYDNETLIFMFSSELYKTKFYDNFIDNREVINKSLSNRFGFEIKADMMGDIALYKKIEKRGFLILKGNGEKIWQKNIILNGERLTSKS